MVQKETWPSRGCRYAGTKSKRCNPGQWILREKKINAENSNRRPDSQIGKTIKIYEVKRNPNSQRNIKREEDNCS